jgi:hypothetical protein
MSTCSAVRRLEPRPEDVVSDGADEQGRPEARRGDRLVATLAAVVPLEGPR